MCECTCTGLRPDTCVAHHAFTGASAWCVCAHLHIYAALTTRLFRPCLVPRQVLHNSLLACNMISHIFVPIFFLFLILRRLSSGIRTHNSLASAALRLRSQLVARDCVSCSTHALRFAQMCMCRCFAPRVTSAGIQMCSSSLSSFFKLPLMVKCSAHSPAIASGNVRVVGRVCVTHSPGCAWMSCAQWNIYMVVTPAFWKCQSQAPSISWQATINCNPSFHNPRKLGLFHSGICSSPSAPHIL